MNLQCDEPLSNFAVIFDLRRYIKGLAGVQLNISPAEAEVLLAHFDKNGDGKVVYGEFLGLIASAA